MGDDFEENLPQLLRLLPLSSHWLLAWMTRHIFSTSLPQKREILLMMTWKCQTCIHSVWRSFGLLVIDMVEYFCQDFAPNMMMVVHFFRRHHQFCHRRRTNIITSHSIGAERLQLKRANFLLLPTIRLKPPLTNTSFAATHCSALLLYCALFFQFSASYWIDWHSPDWHYTKNIPVIWSTLANNLYFHVFINSWIHAQLMG